MNLAALATTLKPGHRPAQEYALGEWLRSTQLRHWLHTDLTQAPASTTPPVLLFTGRSTTGMQTVNSRAWKAP